MSVTILDTKLFLVTWDSGDEERVQTLKVPHQDFYNNPEIYQKNIISMKCLQCNFESNFEVVPQ